MPRSAVARAAAVAVGLVLTSAAVAPRLDAQAAPAGAAPVRYYRAVVGIDPLGIPFDIFSVEGEGAVAPGISLAGALSYVAPGSDNEDRFTSVDVKGRYYPEETALEGFGVGLGVGLTRRSGVVYGPCTDPTQPCEGTRRSATGPTISVLADYNFLLGERRRFFVGTGVGAKRWLVSRDTRESIDAERAWVFARFLVGLAF